MHISTPLCVVFDHSGSYAPSIKIILYDSIPPRKKSLTLSKSIRCLFFLKTVSFSLNTLFIGVYFQNSFFLSGNPIFSNSLIDFVLIS